MLTSVRAVYSCMLLSAATHAPRSLLSPSHWSSLTLTHKHTHVSNDGAPVAHPWSHVRCVDTECTVLPAHGKTLPFMVPETEKGRLTLTILAPDTWALRSTAPDIFAPVRLAHVSVQSSSKAPFEWA